MTIEYYNNISEKNVLNKKIEKLHTGTLTFKTEWNEDAPTLLIENFDANSNYIKLNEKFYFINEVVKFRENVSQLFLELDVLMTYQDDIKNQEAIIKIHDNDSPFLASNQPIRVRNRIQTKAFPNGFSDEISNFVLIVQGGA